MTWQKGIDEVRALISSSSLELISGAAANGAPLLVSADRLLSSADREVEINPEAAFVLAYDAARKACAALLAQQGLRTRSAGHHVTTETVVRAQFGGPFDAFGQLRRRRIEIEYPRFPGDEVSVDEAREALVLSRRIVTAANQLLEDLTILRP